MSPRHDLCYARIHVGPDDGLEASVDELFLIIEGIGLKLALIFLNVGGQFGIREEREAVLCCELSASHGNCNA